MADKLTVDIAAPVKVFAKVAGVVHDGVVDTSKENCRSALAIDEVPVAVTVKVYEPAVLGVPVKTPPLDSDSPTGKVEPDLTA